MFWFYDYWYIVLVMPAIIFSLITSFSVQATFDKYARMRSSRGITGAEAARRVLDANGLYSVKISSVRGNLTDHYNPRDNTIYLSESVYNNPSTAAIGVAAHEAGHAVQHAKGYLPIKIRSAIVPVTNLPQNSHCRLFYWGLYLTLRDGLFWHISELPALPQALCFSLLLCPQSSMPADAPSTPLRATVFYRATSLEMQKRCFQPPR